MIKYYLKYILLLFSSLFLSCAETEEGIINEIDGTYTRLLISPLDSFQTKSRSYSNYASRQLNFQDGDSLLLINISNGFRSKMIYNSSLSCFECDAILNPNDEISVVYPYVDISIVSNRILLNALFQDGYKVNHYYWGNTNIGKVESRTIVSINLFNICNTCSISVTDEKNNSIAIKAISLSALKGKLYKSRFLNIRTGCWEEGLYAETIKIASDSTFPDGKITCSLIPTSALVKGTVEDLKNNFFEGEAEQTIFSENDSSYVTISCTTPALAKDYVVVCGIKWAKGNLLYAGDEKGTDGFQPHWRIASTQYEYFNPVYGMSGTPLAMDLPYDTVHIHVFNWGTCGENALDVTKYGTRSNTDISGKMYTDKYLKYETTNFGEALYGDVVYWASNGKWRMPKLEELYTLFSVASYSCGYIRTLEGELVFGYYFTTPIGKRITDTETICYYTEEDLDYGLFLPGAGYRQQAVPYLKRVGKCGFYWDSNQGDGPEHMCIRFISNNLFWSADGGNYGRSIRPVLTE